MKKINIVIILIILISFIIGIYFYFQFPDRVASHWNARGEVDGYISKFWGAFLMPIISIALWLLFLLIPKIDPLKKNIDKFRKYFNAFIVLIILFLFYIYILTIIWNTGTTFDMSKAMVPAMGILFYYAGVLVKHAERNWFIGIRTPWTLSSERVWKKTHNLGGRLFKISGLITILGVFFPSISMWLVLIPILLSSFYTIIYSYFAYKKERK